jgi:1-acyl-sn-glycerol-3-phosphate acyltransferase
MRNPAIAPAALLAGYEESAGGIDTLRDTAAKVARGETLLVFPEGTRTGIGERLGAFRPGFALIATRGRVPVQSVVIRSSSGLVRRGRAWWRPPTQLPAWMEIEISTRWEYEPARTAVQLATAIEQRMREQISEPVR